ncbi:ABC transporter permease [Nonomuraea gerenzanensis]|uniref:ABC transporter integral membrane protein n=1 Tax=Nonomuraea gerenzanensis TaxID=93944 RepID=A0A1M4E939_9ACTN|nr:ABC transporter permease [Nonomuraea gerenzanensis]UBU17515.1 ABC transporter permease [Nonomuraea gerenzanensis]SBO95272.1 ABC transporter integral membrane protein [Nonomuraea gerenzanensis]
MNARTLWRATGAEWAKLWSVRSTWWCLACALALSVLTSLTLGGAAATDALRDGATGVRIVASEAVVSATSFVQFALVAAAMLVITNEYASGGIRATLQATPARGVVLAAKALVVGPVMFAAGVLFGAVSAVSVYALLSVEVFGGLVVLPFGDLVADLAGMGVFYALVSVLTLGVGAAMRSAAGTLSVMFMLLMGLPLVILMTGVPALLDASLRMPMFAGLAFMGSTENLTGGPMPYPAGEGLGWLLAWVAAAVAVGYAVLRRRDA